MFTRLLLVALAVICAAVLVLTAARSIEAPELIWIGPFNGVPTTANGP
ncbi:Uncharacterised protein [Mycobacteroides abscessus subsp. abscessus]|nr:Uncharacterised protein [Mycobacteroides abscessus subsp. abscessus]